MKTPTPSHYSQLYQAIHKIHVAEMALGRILSAGERSDLLLDNFEWLPGCAESHALVEEIARLEAERK